MNRPVVAAVDGSIDTRSALRWTADFASLHNSPIRLVHVVSSEPSRGDETDAQHLLDAAARFTEKVAPRSVEVTTAVVRGPVSTALVRESDQARILVLGAGAHAPNVRSITATLARRGHCPVVVVRKYTSADSASHKPVLVGVDGTDVCTAALKLAFDEAAHRSVGLVALHAWNDPGASLALGFNGNDVAAAHGLELAESLAGWQERYPEVPVERVIVKNGATRNLFERSSEAQLLIVASHGRSGYDELTNGSTSQALIHISGCPVAVVPSAHADRVGATDLHRSSACAGATAAGD